MNAWIGIAAPVRNTVHLKTPFCLAIALAIAAPVAAQATNYDAVVAAPDSHRILMEDDHVRVLRVEVKPGATEPVHDHRWPSIMYFEQPQPITYIEYKLVDGRPVETQRFDVPAFKQSQTMRGEPEGLHAVSNRGTAPFIAVRVELKDTAVPGKP
ncbi:hypothetical protein [Novosphingobium sp. Leaf2]|uniref:hypothetical protein n=1 Tax=Novosphingobium sp. Leaf2 TaxID=1735670 RepID=UPI001F390BCD|nr:hypothetical protein [Novosphingobium sp. Leaf2]